jgi:hypothetical protein
MLGMLDKKAIELIGRGLKRIFSMKVTRSTYREVQNVILAATQGESEDADKLFRSLLMGQVQDDIVKGDALKMLNRLAEEYSIPIRLAKDVLERGEFVNLLTSDTLNSNNRILFLNRVRRIDGDEFQFITDPVSTVHVLQHFVGRMTELSQTDAGLRVMEQLTKDLDQVKDQLEKLIGLTKANT